MSGSNNETVIYTNNGDGATSDSFILEDASAHPFTINVAIAVSTSPITVSPATAATPNVGTNYSQTLSATGGTAPYTFVLSSGTLPSGLSFSGSTISGTPNQAGSYNVTFTVTDSASLSTTKSYSLTVPNPSSGITVAPPPTANLNTPYSTTLSASGALAPYTFALQSGFSLPPGLSLASNGTISGTPTALGNYNFQVVVTDSSPHLSSSGGPYFRSVPVSLSVQNLPPPVANPVSATVGHGSTNNSITLSLTGGTASTVAVAIQAAHGTATASGTTITYTPTASYSGPDSFTYTATNSAGTSAPATASITVSPPTIAYSPTNPTAATVGVAYSQSIASASGGTAPYTYAVTGGALPAGLTLASNGTISGTPTAAGSFSIQVNATDSSTGTGPFSSAPAPLTVTVGAPTIAVSPTTLPNPTVALVYNQSVSASGGTGPRTFSLTGALPTGLSLNTSTGAITGTPTAGGSFTFTITATDSSTGTSAPFTGSRSYTVTVAAPTITVAPTTLAAATVATAYSQTITASGGTGSYTYAVTTGALPAGMTLDGPSGSLSGTPTAAGNFAFTVTATDSSTGSGPYTGTRNYTLTVNQPTISLNPATLTAGTVGAGYSDTVSASGGVSPYGYTVSAGALPAGLTLDASTGVISGIPTAGGTFNVTVKATDSGTGTGAPFNGTRAYTLTINAPSVAIAPNTIANPSVGVIYSQTFTTSGGTAPYTYAVTGGTLPTGLAFNAATAVLSGTPTAAGSFSFSITTTDSSTGAGPYSNTETYSVTVAAPTLSIGPASLTAATIAASYSESLTASGGTSPYTYTIIAGSLPPGLTLSSSGDITGTPTGGGAFNFTVTATDSTVGAGAPFTVAKPYTLTVGVPTIVLSPSAGALPGGTVGSAYSQTMSASGGTNPYSYSVTAGALPTGLSLNTSTGGITGTPTAGGTFNFTITAADSSTGTGAPFTASNTYSITTVAPTITIAPATLADAPINHAYSETLTASGGISPYSFAVTTGSLPAGLTLSPSGLLSGTPTGAATTNFTVT
ncbi:cadherin-like domain-containing protein, partial [Rhizobium sp. P38BS-XIX]|uniref:putative Ig domain-containing protein n=1 Tax=Rhizobium sp. P38BS-XIX TaxID=2726740 RepID=UPI0014577C61|nr:cadherin-like domain-containing protein [Rhizobium sp. P38BS-XIX]